MFLTTGLIILDPWPYWLGLMEIWVQNIWRARGWGRLECVCSKATKLGLSVLNQLHESHLVWYADKQVMLMWLYILIFIPAELCDSSKGRVSLCVYLELRERMRNKVFYDNLSIPSPRIAVHFWIAIQVYLASFTNSEGEKNILVLVKDVTSKMCL